MVESPIPGPVFEQLPPDQQVLTHWLCYITDAQRPYQQVWEEGGPVFAEVVREYAQGHTEPLAVLERFSRPAKEGRKVDILSSRLQRVGGEKISFAPRYGMHLFSVATTLAILRDHGRGLAGYLAANWSFCQEAPGGDGDDPVHRAAFLLHLLSYWEIPKGLSSVRSAEFVRAVEKRSQQVAETMADPKALQEEYRYWLTHDDRYGKRLWAAFRDSVKPGSAFREPFLRALEAIGRSDIAGYFRRNAAEALRALEIPGDVWNNRFFEKLFGPDATPATFRGWYEDLRKTGRLPPDTYVEQFDVSFEYAASMCADRSFETCVFRQASRVRALCPPLSGATWAGKPCPVAAYLCGYEYPCSPEGCPVREGPPEDLCPGCAFDVSVGGSTAGARSVPIRHSRPLGLDRADNVR